jgi:hypothetical protein
VGVSLLFLFDSEYSGDMSLRNVELSPNYTALQSRKSYFHLCEKLKSNKLYPAPQTELDVSEEHIACIISVKENKSRHRQTKRAR